MSAGKDLVNNVKFVQVVAPASLTADTTGTGVDRKGYESAALEVNVGNTTGLTTANTVACKMLESDSTGSTTYTAVAQSDIVNSDSTSSTDGTVLLLNNSTAQENTIYSYGYKGAKRYFRMDLDETGTATFPASVTAVLGSAHVAPVI